MANNQTPHTKFLTGSAEDFAAAFLMPLDDFRRQLLARASVNLHAIGACADRYETSLLATVLKWLSDIERRAVLVVAREGYVDWSRSNDAALWTGPMSILQS